MKGYAVGVTTPAAASGAPFAAIRADATHPVYILEMGITNNSATTSSIQIVRALTNGTATTSVLGQQQDPRDAAGTGLVETAWAAAPTIGTNVPSRRILFTNAGQGVIFTWVLDRPLVVPVSSSVLLWNFGALTASALSYYVVWIE